MDARNRDIATMAFQVDGQRFARGPGSATRCLRWRRADTGEPSVVARAVRPARAPRAALWRTGCRERPANPRVTSQPPTGDHDRSDALHRSAATAEALTRIGSQ